MNSFLGALRMAWVCSDDTDEHRALQRTDGLLLAVGSLLKPAATAAISTNLPCSAQAASVRSEPDLPRAIRRREVVTRSCPRASAKTAVAVLLGAVTNLLTLVGQYRASYD
jgi:hypothetical protein